MAFPSVTTATTTTFATSVTTMAVNLPASISSGDLLIAHVGVRNPGTWTVPTDWVLLAETAGGGGVGETGVWYKIADGTEGSTATWTAGVATTGAWHVRKVTSWHGTTPPEYATTNGDFSTAPDPPSLTPSWGSDDTLWLALAGSSATVMNFTGAPASYTDLVSTVASSGGGASNAGSAVRENATATEDPGLFTTSQNRWWTTFTVAVRPSAGGDDHTLASNDISLAHQIGGPLGIVQTYPDDVSLTQTIDNTAITQNHVVVSSDIGFSLQTDESSVAQNHVIATQDISHSFTEDNTSISIEGDTYTIVTQDIAHSLTEDNTTVVDLTSRYWVGETGDWTDTAHWSLTSGGTGGASVPGVSDDVYFDANSFSSPGQTVTLLSSPLIKSIDTSSATNSPMLIFGNYSINIRDGGGGSSIDFSGVTVNYVNGGYIFLDNSGVYNLTSGGNTFRDVDYNSTNTTLNLLDDFNVSASFTVASYTSSEDLYFNTNNHNVTVGLNLYLNTQLVADFGTSTVTVGRKLDLSYSDFGSATNISASNATFIITGNNYSYFASSDQTIGTLELQQNATIYAYGQTISNLILTAGKTYTMDVTGTPDSITINNLDAVGTAGNLITITSSSAHSFIKASGTVTADYLHLTNSTATGGATFNAYNSVDNGGNTGWNFFVDIIPQDISHGLTIDTTTINQNHVIGNQDVAHNLDVETTEIIQNHVIGADDIGFIVGEDNGGISQNHVIATQDISHDLTIDTTSILVNQVIVNQDISMGLLVGVPMPLLDESGDPILNEAGNPIYQEAYGDTTITIEEFNLIIQDISHTLTEDNTTFTQEQSLVTQDVSLTLTEDNLLVAPNVITQNIGLGLTEDSTTITQNHSIGVDDLAFSLTSDTGSNTQNHIIATQDTSLVLNVDTNAINQNHIVVSSDITHSTSLDNTTLIENYYLLINEISHSLTVDNNTVENTNHFLATGDVYLGPPKKEFFFDEEGTVYWVIDHNIGIIQKV